MTIHDHWRRQCMIGLLRKLSVHDKLMSRAVTSSRPVKNRVNDKQPR
jgi:hypothetical protein